MSGALTDTCLPQPAHRSSVQALVLIESILSGSKRRVVIFEARFGKEIVIITCPMLWSNSHAYNDTIGH